MSSGSGISCRFGVILALCCLLIFPLSTCWSEEVPGQPAEVAGEQELPDEEILDEEFLEDDPFAEDEPQIEVSDPLEKLNRGIFWVNDKLYTYLFKPIARAYRFVPEPARESVDNFLFNIRMPIRLVNSLLQARFETAGIVVQRFAINTTVGVLGLFDPARNRFEMQRINEDLGQTFGVWGLGPGWYIVLPVFGPSNVRDGIGIFLDNLYLNPWSYIADGDYYWYVLFIELQTKLSLDKDTYESIKEEQLDPYLFIRDAFMQRREALIAK